VRKQLTWLVDTLERTTMTEVVQGVGALGAIEDGYYVLYPKANISAGLYFSSLY